jgi:hypothetical protein
MNLRARIARRLRHTADRIDPTTGPRRMTAVSGFTYEPGLGIVFRDDGRGCPVWYMNQDYHRAHDEAGDIKPGTWIETWQPELAVTEYAERLKQAHTYAQDQVGKPYTWGPIGTTTSGPVWPFGGTA